MVFIENSVNEIKMNIEECQNYQIKGLYTVPELKIKDNPFIEVIKAIEKYYKNKLHSQLKKSA